MSAVLGGVIPSAGQVATTDNYVSTINIHKPDIDAEFYDRYIDELLLLDLMEMLGQSKPVRQTSYTHYEAPQLLNYINNGLSVSDPTAGNPVTIQLESNNHLNSGTVSVPRINDLVLFANNVVGQITAKNTSTPYQHTITVYPLQSTDDIGALSPGDAVVIFSNAWAPGTVGNVGKTWSALSYTNTCQIIKEAFLAEGSEMTNQIWVEVENEDGSTGYVWYYEGERNTYRNMRVIMEQNLLLTPPTTTATLTNGLMRTSQGMWNYINTAGGIDYPYNQGQMTLAEHKKMIKLLDKQGTYAKNYAYIQGIDLNDEYQNFITTAMQNGAVDYGGFTGGKDMAINLDFESIKTLGYTFHLKVYRLFNNQNNLGAPGFNWPGNGVCMPMKTLVHPKTGRPVPYFRLRTKEAAGYNRGMEHWYIGGAGNIKKTSSTDVMEMHYRSESSVEFFAANQWIAVNRTN